MARRERGKIGEFVALGGNERQGRLSQRERNQDVNEWHSSKTVRQPHTIHHIHKTHRSINLTMNSITVHQGILKQWRHCIDVVLAHFTAIHETIMMIRGSKEDVEKRKKRKDRWTDR